MELNKKTRAILSLGLVCLQEGVLGAGKEWARAADRNARTYLVNSGTWGTWKAMNFAPHNYFACGFKLRTERNQGSDDDDSALNGLQLKVCNAYDWGDQKNLMVENGSWGDWNENFSMCPRGQYISQMNVLFESNQGSGEDDTGANNLKVKCQAPNSRTGTVVRGDSQTSWGNWRGWSTGRYNHFVYAVKDRFEAKAGYDDDTALNGLKVRTAQWQPKPSVNFGARWAEVAGVSQGLEHKYSVGVSSSRSEEKRRESVNEVAKALRNTQSTCMAAEVGYKSPAATGGMNGRLSAQGCIATEREASTQQSIMVAQTLTETAEMRENAEWSFECAARPGLSLRIFQWTITIPSRDLEYATKHFKCVYGNLRPQCPKGECMDDQCQVCTSDTGAAARAARQCYIKASEKANAAMRSCSAKFTRANGGN